MTRGLFSLGLKAGLMLLVALSTLTVAGCSSDVKVEPYPENYLKESPYDESKLTPKQKKIIERAKIERGT